jgi:acyl-coenzyme A thioesterase PaaI-like protein
VEAERTERRSEPGTSESAGPPEIMARPDWVPVAPFQLEAEGSFLAGHESERLRVRYFRRGGDGRLVGRAWFGPGTQGPPGHAHGGSIAAVLDEAMGAAAWLEGHRSVAAHLATNFRRMLPLGTDAILEAWVQRVEGRKVWTLSRLSDDDDRPFADAEALFVVLDAERLRPLLEKVAAARGVDPERLLREI